MPIETPQESRPAPSRLRRVLAAAAASLVLATGLIMTAAAPAHAAYNPGRVCNNSSVTVWLTVESGGRWSVQTLGRGACTNYLSWDVEAVWGRRCDPQGRCWHVAWKVNGWTTTTLRDGYISPLIPGRALYVSGSGSWSMDGGWPKPSLNSIGYDLR